MNNGKENYSILKINISKFDTELLPEFFFRHGCSGIEELNDHHWQVYFAGGLGAAKYADIVESLQTLNPQIQAEDISTYQKRGQDWLTEWKKFFHPIRVGASTWVLPPWEKIVLPAKEVGIIIDPQMAFGTGHHETTQMMIELVEAYICEGDKVLDVGTGSGILAILSKKRGASEIWGCDIDGEAIANAKHNAVLNDAKDIFFEKGDIQVIPAESFDLVLANINLAAIRNILSGLYGKLKSTGTLILSGVLEDDLPLIKTIIGKTLSVLELRSMNEWRALVLKK
jgi:ribosomal protein L11 methyltransferase